MDELKKQEGWFKVQNKFFDTYASHFTLTEALVYLTICRYRKNGTNESIPISQETIGKKFNSTRETVNRCIEQLESHNFLRLIKLKRSGGKWQYGKYEIIDDNLWLPPCASKSHGEEASPCDICIKNGVRNCHTKKTKEKNINTEQMLEMREKVANGIKLPWRIRY